MQNKLHTLEIAATFDIYQVRDKRLVVEPNTKILHLPDRQTSENLEGTFFGILFRLLFDL